MTQMPLTLLIDLFLPFFVGWEVGVRQQRMWGNDSMTCSFLCFPLPPPPFSPFHHSIHPPPFFFGSSRRQRAPKMAALVPGGPQAALPSPIITGAMLGCLPICIMPSWHFHFRHPSPAAWVPRPALSLRLPLIASCVYLPKHKRLIPRCLSALCSADRDFRRMMKHPVS